MGGRSSGQSGMSGEVIKRRERGGSRDDGVGGESFPRWSDSLDAARECDRERGYLSGIMKAE